MNNIHTEYTQKLPALLFWQYLVVCFILGILATRFMDFALCSGLFILLAFFYLYYRIENKNRFICRLILAFSCAIAAFYYTPLVSPKLNIKEKETWEHFNDPMEYVLIKGTVTASQAQPFGRLRFFLKDVEAYKMCDIETSFTQNDYDNPNSFTYKKDDFSSLDFKKLSAQEIYTYILQNPEKKTSLDTAVIPHTLSLSWDRAHYFLERPVHGDTIIAKTRVRETYGDIGEYWASKDVWYTTYVYKKENIFWTNHQENLSTSPIKYDVSNSYIPNNLKKEDPTTNFEDKPSFLQNIKNSIIHFFAHAREILRRKFVEIIYAPNISPVSIFSKQSAPKMDDMGGWGRLSPPEKVEHHHTPTSNSYTIIPPQFHEYLDTPHGQARAILPAILFGDRFYISAQTQEVFNSANLLHSLALSGQHLALATLLASLIITCFVWRKPTILHTFPRRRLIFYISLPLALLYVFLGSAPLSLLRAFAMFLFAGIFWLNARTITLLDCLFYALAFFCLLNPLSIFDLGVQLSFICVFSIAFFMPLIQAPKQLFAKKTQELVKQKNSLRSERTFRKQYTLKFNLSTTTKKFKIILQQSLIFMIRGLSALFLISFIIQITTFPIILSYFGKVSFFFLLNNIWIPLLAILVLPFAAFALIILALQTTTSSFITFLANLLSYVITLPTSMTDILQKIVVFSSNAMQYIIQIFIDIASYPAQLLIEFLLYLQNLGFDPYVQFPKPDIIFFLGFYAILIFLVYTQKYLYIMHAVPHSSAEFQNQNSRNAFKIPQNYTLFKSPYFTLYALFTVVCLSTPFIPYLLEKPYFSVTVFDVGQGQSILIDNRLAPEEKHSTSHVSLNSQIQGRILIDTGGSHSPRFNVGRDIIAHKLTQNKLPRIAYVIASHDDADHINGLHPLLQYFNVKTFAEPYLTPEKKSATRTALDSILEKQNTPIDKLGMGDILHLGNGFALQVLHPPYPLETAKSLASLDYIMSDASAQTNANLLAPATRHSDLDFLGGIIPLTKAYALRFPKGGKPFGGEFERQRLSKQNALPLLAKPQASYSSNNSSLVLRLVKDGKGLALFCGDVENSVLEDLVRYHHNNMWSYNPLSTHAPKPMIVEKFEAKQNRFTLTSQEFNQQANQHSHQSNNQDFSLEADILILPHHGSKNSYYPDFYDAVNPHTVIASAGKYNRFGFPAPIIEEYFRSKSTNKQKINFLITANTGDITLKWDKDTLILEEKE